MVATYEFAERRLVATEHSFQELGVIHEERVPPAETLCNAIAARRTVLRHLCHNQGEIMKLHRSTSIARRGEPDPRVGVLATSSFAGATSAKDQPTGHALFVESDADRRATPSSVTREAPTGLFRTSRPTRPVAPVPPRPVRGRPTREPGRPGARRQRERTARHQRRKRHRVGLRRLWSVPAPHPADLDERRLSRCRFRSHNNLVAVLNAGGTGSVTEYQLQWGRLVATGQTAVARTRPTPHRQTSSPVRVRWATARTDSSSS